MLSKGNQIKLGSQFNEGGGASVSRGVGFVSRLVGGPNKKATGGKCVYLDGFVYLFGGLEHDEGVLMKINVKTGVITTMVDTRIDDVATHNGICTDGTHIYVAGVYGGSSGYIRIIKFDTDLVEQDVVNQTPSGTFTGSTSILVLEGFLYVFCHSGFLIKVAISDLTTASWCKMIGGASSGKINIVTDGTYLYCNRGVGIHKIDTDGVSQLFAYCGNDISDAMCCDGTYIYAIDGVRLIKLACSDLTIDEDIILSSLGYSVFADDNYVYVGSQEKIIRVDKSFTTAQKYEDVNFNHNFYGITGYKGTIYGGFSQNSDGYNVGLWILKPSIITEASTNDDSVTFTIAVDTLSPVSMAMTPASYSVSPSSITLVGGASSSTYNHAKWYSTIHNP